MVQNDLVVAWTNYLSQWPWDWFCTLTFRESVHPERAAKVFRMWTCEINRDIYGRRWREKNLGIYWVKALEYQRRGVIHFHTLMSGRGANLNQQAKRFKYMQRWDQLAGFAKIEPPRDGAVVNYVSKYVAKGGEIELSESLGHFQAYRGQRFLQTGGRVSVLLGPGKTCTGDGSVNL